MIERNTLYLERIKGSSYRIFFFAIIIYGLTLTFLYNYFNDAAEVKKSQILQDYYNQIIAISINKISSSLQKISSSFQNKNILLSINNNDLKICSDNRCINYNLFGFRASLDKYIPEFIFYRIELNKKFLLANVRFQNYQIEKTYYINEYNQLDLSLSIDEAYWAKVRAVIWKPFWIILIFALGNIGLLYLLNRISSKNFNKFYNSYYQHCYKDELDQLEDSLMNKMWDINFNKQKDLEINCLFAQEANKLSLTNENLNIESSNDQEKMLKNYRLKNYGDKVPCSIVLYHDKSIEEIHIPELINLFNARFQKENENIEVKVISKAKVIHFVSQAALYQIIYSIINYLIFIINKQAPNRKRHIILLIDHVEEGVKLRFEYDGFPITNENELLKMSNDFFKTHANPFLLNINQVFNILRTRGFNCKVRHNKLNIIKILPKKQKGEQPIKTADNVVSLSSFTEKN